MTSQQSIVDFIAEQMADAGEITSKKMFGEYGIYCDAKIIGLICDDQLFLKPTVGGKVFIEKSLGNIEEAPPYPGAKLSLLITAQNWEDSDWLSELVKISFAELPMQKKRKPKKKTPSVGL